MANLFVWLLAAAGPVAKKVLAVLGVGVISYGAIIPLINSVIGQAQANYGQITGFAASIVALAGLPDVLGILTGAMLAKVSLMVLEKFGKITT